MDPKFDSCAQSYPASILNLLGSERYPPIFKARVGNLSSAGDATGRSQNVPIHLHLVNTRITYDSFNIFYIGPLDLPDLRPDLEASASRDFAYVTIFAKIQIFS